jgi:propionyl-CoA carboxylase beta chain
MYVTGPKVIEKISGQICTSLKLGGADLHGEQSGVAHGIYDTEEACYQDIRKLIGYLPSCCNFQNQISVQYIDKSMLEIDKVIPKEKRKTYDVRNVIAEIVDDNSFFELQENFAVNIVIGFAKISEVVAGIVANQPRFLCGVLDCNASDKAARFVRFCDSYNIPIITFVDTPGFLPSSEQEKMGIIRHGAKLLYAFSEATTIKISIIIRKAYGGAYIAMCSKHLQADYVFSWPGAEIAVMGPEGAVEILYQKQLKELGEEERKKLMKSKNEEYDEVYVNSKAALKEGYIDLEIKPSETRRTIFSAINSLKNKHIPVDIEKKHGNIPL